MDVDYYSRKGPNHLKNSLVYCFLISIPTKKYFSMPHDILEVRITSLVKIYTIARTTCSHRRLDRHRRRRQRAAIRDDLHGLDLRRGQHMWLTQIRAAIASLTSASLSPPPCARRCLPHLRLALTIASPTSALLSLPPPSPSNCARRRLSHLRLVLLPLVLASRSPSTTSTRQPLPPSCSGDCLLLPA